MSLRLKKCWGLNEGVNMFKIKRYGHNFYWSDKPIHWAVQQGVEVIELDIVYRLFGNNIWISHSWRPHNKLYHGTLLSWLLRVRAYNKITDKKIKAVIIECKSFWIPQKKLARLINMFNKYQEKDGNDCKIVMSVQSRYLHQWTRGWWLESFYNKYKDNLKILDKRTETELNVQVDLYPKYSWWKRIIKNQF